MTDTKKITIFRLNAGDTTAVVPSGTEQIIKFNVKEQSSPTTNFKKHDKEGAYIESIKLVIPEGIGNNQTAEKTDGNIQPLGVTGTFYEIRGFITKLDGNSGNGNNIFLSRLLNWKEGTQQIKVDWEAGRFGIEDLNDSTNTLKPIRTNLGGGPALIFSNYEKTNDYKANLARFVLTFRRGRGLDI